MIIENRSSKYEFISAQGLEKSLIERFSERNSLGITLAVAYETIDSNYNEGFGGPTVLAQTDCRKVGTFQS